MDPVDGDPSAAGDSLHGARANLAVKLLATADEPAVESHAAWLREIERRLDALVTSEDPGEDWDAIHRDLVAEFGEG